MSVQHLAEIIAGDLATISRVISVANTLGYNPDGVPVSTLMEAIHVIGFQSVSNLAVALLLFDSGDAGAHSLECRETSALALVSGLLAQTFAEHAHSPEAEHAFICTALRHYGKLATSTFLLEEHRRAQSRESELGADPAFRLVFGLTSLELAQGLLAEAQIPANILVTMQTLPREKIGSDHLSATGRLAALAEFSSKLCSYVAEQKVTPLEFENHAKALADDYGSAFNLRGGDIVAVLAEVDEKLSSFGVAHGKRFFSTRLIQGIRALVADQDAPATEGRTPASASGGRGSEADREQLFADALDQFASIAASSPKKSEVMLTMLAGMLREGLGLAACLIFCPAGSGQLFAPRIGNGELFSQIRDQPLLDPKQKTIFSICLNRGDDVIIEDPGDEKISPFVPEWLRPGVRGCALILLPIRTENRTLAIVCGICPPGTPLLFAESRKQQVKMLRQHVAQAWAAANPSNRPGTTTAPSA